MNTTVNINDLKKDELVAYATEQGFTAEELEGKNMDEIKAMIKDAQADESDGEADQAAEEAAKEAAAKEAAEKEAAAKKEAEEKEAAKKKVEAAKDDEEYTPEEEKAKDLPELPELDQYNIPNARPDEKGVEFKLNTKMGGVNYFKGYRYKITKAQAEVLKANNII